jgi:WD40 repeat protein
MQKTSFSRLENQAKFRGPDHEYSHTPGESGSPTQRYINAGLLESSVAIWDRQNKEPLMMSGYERKVSEMAWSHLGSRYQKLLFAAGGGREITLWDFSDGPPDGQKPKFLAGHKAKVNDLRFLKKAHWLLSVGDDGDLRIWQGSRNWKPGDILRHGQPLHQMIMPPSEDRLLLLGDRGKVWLYQL